MPWISPTPSVSQWPDCVCGNFGHHTYCCAAQSKLALARSVKVRRRCATVLLIAHKGASRHHARAAPVGTITLGLVPRGRRTDIGEAGKQAGRAEQGRHRWSMAALSVDGAIPTEKMATP